MFQNRNHILFYPFVFYKKYIPLNSFILLYISLFNKFNYKKFKSLIKYYSLKYKVQIILDP